MESGLRGRTAVVAGGSLGIGRAIVAAFAGEGMRVVAVGRDRERLGSLVRDVRAAQPDADVVDLSADVSNRDSVDRLAEAVRERYGSIHVIVNNAGNRM